MVSGETDVSGIFDRAVESADRLGRSISEIMDAVNEFSRQGFRGEDLNLLSDAATIASNVAEMDVGQSAEFLTSTITQWKMEAEDAMGIIDSYNEIANNFGTSAEYLAQGQSRAAATARAMGLDFDNNLSK